MNLMKVLSLHKMVFVLILNLVLLINTNINAQRTHHDIEREETLRNRQVSKQVNQQFINNEISTIFLNSPSFISYIIYSLTLQQNVDIGEFPYNRGETPIFNFDIGDEPFLQVIGKSINVKKCMLIMQLAYKLF